MKKTVCLLLVLLSAAFFSLSAESALPGGDSPDGWYGPDITDDLEDYDAFDDFDALFDDAPEDVVVEEAPVPTVEAKETSSSSSLLNITGNFSGRTGAAAGYNGSSFYAGGVLDISNTLSLNIKPSPLFGVHGSLASSLSNRFSLSVSSLYFDTLLFDSVYLSAGRKSLSWGPPRMLKNGTDLMAGSGNGVLLEMSIPWQLGTVTGVMLYDTSNISSDLEAACDWRKAEYAIAGDITLAGVNINLFSKIIPGSDGGALRNMQIQAGTEMKRTLFGYDAYLQGIAAASIDSVKKITATAGFYRLWDNSRPHFGINAEYQFAFTTGTAPSASVQKHEAAIDLGIRRLGKDGNMKGAISWRHNFSENSGSTEGAFFISGIIPYAEIMLGIKSSYGDGKNFSITGGLSVNFSLSY